MRLINGLSTFFDLLIKGMAVMAGVLLAFSILSISIAIVARSFFGSPVGWVMEINAYVLLYITFLVAAWVTIHLPVISKSSPSKDKLR